MHLPACCESTDLPPSSLPHPFQFRLVVSGSVVCGALEHIPLTPSSPPALRSVPRAVITSTNRASSLSLLVHNQGMMEDGVLILFPSPLGIATLCLLPLTAQMQWRPRQLLLLALVGSRPEDNQNAN